MTDMTKNPGDDPAELQGSFEPPPILTGKNRMFDSPDASSDIPGAGDQSFMGPEVKSRKD